MRNDIDAVPLPGENEPLAPDRCPRRLRLRLSEAAFPICSATAPQRLMFLIAPDRWRDIVDHGLLLGEGRLFWVAIIDDRVNGFDSVGLKICP
jgi:hypothetical protein